MKTIFFVLSSLYDEDTVPQGLCHIVLENQEQLIPLADFLEKETPLTVFALKRLDNFFYTVGTFTRCGVLEVHLKDDVRSADLDITCEQIAIAETYSFFAKQAINKC